jgi:hypothetical protein
VRALAASTLALTLLLGGCGGSFVGMAIPSATATPVVPAIVVQVKGRLDMVRDVAEVTATQSGYAGPFTFSTTDDHVLTLTLSPPPGGGATPRRTGGKYSVVSKNGRVYVAAVGAGTASISVRGEGTSKAFPQELQGVKISPAVGSVVVTPSNLVFDATGASHAQSVVVSQPGFTGDFTETDDCSGIVTVASTNRTAYRVVPVAAGTCAAVFTGAAKQAARLRIEVESGSVVVSPSSLTFDAIGSSHAQNVAVSESGFTGAFVEKNDCTGIATIDSSSNAKGKASYVVVPSNTGSCSAHFTGLPNQSAPLAIHVVAGSVVVSPSSLTFGATGAGNAKNVTVSQSGYGGTFAASGDCSGIATVSASRNADGKAAYAVTPAGAGSCDETFTGGGGKSAPLTIVVTVPGGVSASPAPLAFQRTGKSSAIVETVTQPGYHGKFAESDTCAGIATLAAGGNAGGTAAYSVTPVSAGRCQAVFTGGNQQSFTLHVGVTSTTFGLKNISKNAQSATVTVNGGTPQAIALAPAGTNCSGNGTSTPIVCTGLIVAAAAGSDTFAIAVYEEALSGGHEPANPTLLATAAASVPIVSGSANTLGTLALDPVVGSLSLGIGAPHGGYAAGQAASGIAVTLSANDPSGAPIIAPSKYANAAGKLVPVTISSSQTAPFQSAFTFSVNGGTAKATARLAGPADAATMNYSGLSVPATIFTAASGSVSTTAHRAAIEGVPVALSVVCAESNDVCTNGTTSTAGTIQFTQLADTASLTPSEPGWTEPPYSQGFLLESDTCNTADDPSATGNWATLSPVVGASGASFLVTAQNASSNSATPAKCVAVLQDGLGRQLTLDISVTLTGVGINAR